MAVTAVRYQAIVHDFAMLNSLRHTSAAVAAIDRAEVIAPPQNVRL